MTTEESDLSYEVLPMRVSFDPTKPNAGPTNHIEVWITNDTDTFLSWKIGSNRQGFMFKKDEDKQSVHFGNLKPKTSAYLIITNKDFGLNKEDYGIFEIFLCKFLENFTYFRRTLENQFNSAEFSQKKAEVKFTKISLKYAM